MLPAAGEIGQSLRAAFPATCRSVLRFALFLFEAPFRPAGYQTLQIFQDRSLGIGFAVVGRLKTLSRILPVAVRSSGFFWLGTRRFEGIEDFEDANAASTAVALEMDESHPLRLPALFEQALLRNPRILPSYVTSGAVG